MIEVAKYFNSIKDHKDNDCVITHKHVINHYLLAFVTTIRIVGLVFKNTKICKKKEHLSIYVTLG